MKDIMLIKFGGSLITDKGEGEKVNQQNIDLLTEQLKDIREKNKDTPIILGTGAGSFGHIQVKKYKLEEGVKSFDQKLGFSKIADSVSRLNGKVIKALLTKKIPAVSVKPSSIFTVEAGAVKYFFLDSLLGFIKTGIMPVVYGDMVYDSLTGGSVLSTDRIFYELANIFTKQQIKVSKVIFCGSTKGVLDNNGKTIKKITIQNLKSYSDIFFDNKFVDVTGGMKKKVQTGLWISTLGIKCRIINGASLATCATDDKFDGTVIGL